MSQLLFWGKIYKCVKIKMLCLTLLWDVTEEWLLKGTLVLGKPVQCIVRCSFSKEELFLQAGLGDRTLVSVYKVTSSNSGLAVFLRSELHLSFQTSANESFECELPRGSIMAKLTCT